MSTDSDAARVLAALEWSHTEALDVMLGIHFPEDAPHPRAGRVGHRSWAEMRREMLARHEAQAMGGDVEVWVDGDGRFVMDVIPAEELERSAVDLARRTAMTTEEARDALERASRTTGALVREVWVHLATDATRLTETLRTLWDAASEPPPDGPEDPRERALWARRNRNTGPRPGRYRYDGTRRNG